jgi:hypothetical protein
MPFGSGRRVQLPRQCLPWAGSCSPWGSDPAGAGTPSSSRAWSAAGGGGGGYEDRLIGGVSSFAFMVRIASWHSFLCTAAQSK